MHLVTDQFRFMFGRVKQILPRVVARNWSVFMVKRLAIGIAFCAILSLNFLIAPPAHATGNIACTATDGSDAEILLVVGSVPVLAIVNGFITDGSQDWSLDGSAGTQIMVGQQFMDDERVLADFVDTNIEKILISLRLFRGFTGKSSAEAGILTIHDVGVFPLTCEEG